MVEAPNHVQRLRKAADQMRRENQNGWPLTCDAAAAEIESLQRQIAELRAQSDRFCDKYLAALKRAEAAEAENARLRALPLKDEVERVLEPFVRFIEHHDGPRGMKAASATAKADDFVILRLSPGYPPVTLGHLRAARALLSRLWEGEQEGWKPIKTAPNDGDPILVVGGRHLAPVIVPADGEWWRSVGGTAAPTHWMPLPAAPSEQGGDRG